MKESQKINFILDKGGLGNELSKWVVDGSADLDLFSFDCARFHPDAISSKKWVTDRTHERFFFF